MANIVKTGSGGRALTQRSSSSVHGPTFNGAFSGGSGVQGSTSFTSNGRPMLVAIYSANIGANQGYIVCTSGGRFNFTRDGSRVGGPVSVATGEELYEGLYYIDVVAAGTYTYGVQAETGNFTANNVEMFIIELD